FFFSSRRRHTRFSRDWSSDVCSSDLGHHRAHRVRLHLRLAAPVRAARALFGGRLAAGLRAGHPPGGLRPAPGGGQLAPAAERLRSEERRVGKEWRWRWSPEGETAIEV